MNAFPKSMPETGNGKFMGTWHVLRSWQTFGKTIKKKSRLAAGTIFAELDKPFTGKCQYMMYKQR